MTQDSQARAYPTEPSAADKLVPMPPAREAAGRPNDLNARLGSLERALEALDGQLHTARERVAALEQESAGRDEALAGELVQARERLRTLEQQHAVLSGHFERLSAATRELNDEMAERHARLTHALENGMEAVTARAESDRLALTARQDVLATEMAKANRRVTRLGDALERRIDELLTASEAVATRLQQRLDTIARESEERDAALGRRADDLQNQTSGLRGRIEGLEYEAGALGRRLAALAEQMRRHVGRTAAGFALLLLLVGALAWYQHGVWQDTLAQQRQALAASEQAEAALHERIQALQGALAATQTRVDATLDTHAGQLAAVERQLVATGDAVQSLDGRLTTVAPNSRFGADGIIHGPAWLAQQSPDAYVVRLIEVADRQELYRVAERWGHYLRENLAYLETGAGERKRYVLVYGPFADRGEAQRVSHRLPPPDLRQRPTVARVGDLPLPDAL